MKIKKFYLVLFCSAFLFVTLTAYVSRNKSLTKVFGKSEIVKVVNPDEGKVKFNHELHLKDAGLVCKDCHNKAYTSDKATDNIFPSKDDCAKCHEVKNDKECNKCHYYNKFEKLTSSGKQLVFSHKKHLDKNSDCLQCHAGIDKSKTKGDIPNGGYAPMSTCYTCHDGKKNVNNCEACHTNLTNLKPKDHLNSNYLNEHKVFTDAVSGDANNNCMMCHSSYFCEACHQPVKYSGENRPENFYTPYYTKDFATRTDRTSLQKLTTIHDLNYQYTHGLDANQKSFECKTCHDPVDFCASCHQNGGNRQTGLMPKNHLTSNFKTFGVNTGGGLHADLARRDIESCEACHSVNGADPVCIQCHIDNDGVKGTNPKTHETGFMSDEKGNWHSIKGAICYTCHVDGNARPDGIAGVGFCGYCHGNIGDRKLK